MTRSGIAFWIWTAVYFLGALFVGRIATRNVVYQGTEVSFQTGRDLVIEAKTDTVSLVAASPNFFLLRKESGESVVAVPTTPPIGWTDAEYYVAGPQDVTEGKWLFPDGSATFKITAEKPMVVTVVDPHPVSDWIITFLIAALVWVIIILVASS